MCDKVAIYAYILKIVEKDPLSRLQMSAKENDSFLRLQMRAKEDFNRHQRFPQISNTKRVN